MAPKMDGCLCVQVRDTVRMLQCGAGGALTAGEQPRVCLAPITRGKSKRKLIVTMATPSGLSAGARHSCCHKVKAVGSSGGGERGGGVGGDVFSLEKPWQQLFLREQLCTAGPRGRGWGVSVPAVLCRQR